MAILKFRVYFEEDDSVYRDIAIKHTQHFSDLHLAILRSYEFDTKQDFLIESNNPILVGQFMHGSDSPDPNNDTCESKFANMSSNICTQSWTKQGIPISCKKNADCAPTGPCDVPTCEVATGKCLVGKKPGCCVDDSGCDDGDPCTVDACELASGQCKSAAKVCDPPALSCQTSACNPTTPACAVPRVPPNSSAPVEAASPTIFTLSAVTTSACACAKICA